VGEIFKLKQKTGLNRFFASSKLFTAKGLSLHLKDKVSGIIPRRLVNYGNTGKAACGKVKT